ncbi:MAG: hypothetical protein DWQ31_15845 [Planctomycetota bacterium]|nr:MAG: hypothetical protein DWQ31_15845 [Planctomycetota bacterium]
MSTIEPYRAHDSFTALWHRGVRWLAVLVVVVTALELLFGGRGAGEIASREVPAAETAPQDAVDEERERTGAKPGDEGAGVAGEGEVLGEITEPLSESESDSLLEGLVVAERASDGDAESASDDDGWQPVAIALDAEEPKAGAEPDMPAAADVAAVEPAEPSTTATSKDPTPQADEAPKESPEQSPPVETPGESPAEPDGSVVPAAKLTPAQKFSTITLRGRIVWLNDALLRRFAIATAADAREQMLALETDDGEIHPVVEDTRGHAFRLDPRLRERPVEVLARRHEGSPLIQVIRLYALREDGRYELDYWCDICAIQMFQYGVCDCCQGDNRLRERQVNADGKPIDAVSASSDK